MGEGGASYRTLLAEGERLLREAGIAEYTVEARNILLHSFSLSWADLVLNKDREIQDGAGTERFYACLRERQGRKPLQYIIGEQNFCGLDFYVNEHVLIPRLDTEVLVERIIEENTEKDIHILDLCTGSGAIAVSLKKRGAYERVSASDISARALEIAEKNALRHKVDISLIQSDLFSGIAGRYDMIVSNPPYIPRAEIEKLAPEVRGYEPHLALDGGEEGLDFYRRIAEEAADFLQDGGKIYLEIGCEQAPAIRRIFSRYREVAVYQDLAKKDRVARILK